MSPAWEQIEAIVGKVRNLSITPLAAINFIDDIRPPRPGVSGRAWLALCSFIMFLSFMIGWAARVHTTGDRYIKSLVEQHEAAARFYNERTDQLIHATQPKGVKIP